MNSKNCKFDILRRYTRVERNINPSRYTFIVHKTSSLYTDDLIHDGFIYNDEFSETINNGGLCNIILTYHNLTKKGVEYLEMIEEFRSL